MKHTLVNRAITSLKYIASNILHGEGRFPFYASFKVTNECMLNCECCDIWRERTLDTLNTQDVKRIMMNLAKSSIFALCYEGGEPLLRDDIEEILKFGSQMPYLTSMVTSGIDLHLVERCCQYLDFLHLSIDEFHKNENLYQRLEGLVSECRIRIIVQIVASKHTMDTLEEKIRLIRTAKAKVCVMPAVHLDLTENLYPEPDRFRSLILMLKKKYPGTIITAKNYLDSIIRHNGCSTSSIIIDSDGGLYYPCRTLRHKPVSLLESSLMQFLRSYEAGECRRRLEKCSRSCGWYQYFAVSFVSCRSLFTEIYDLVERVI